LGNGGLTKAETTVAAVWILMTIVGGLLFYGLRCRYQFVYGLIELGAALTIIFLTFLPQTPSYLELAEQPSWWGSFLSQGVGISAGIYVLVRALDNIEKGWPPHRWERTRRNFRRVFGIRPTS
jgi:hypothetical protein